MALSNTGRPEAFAVLSDAAKGGRDYPIDRDTQLAAVRGLARLRTPESVAVLVDVMKTENGKDPAMTSRARESLVSLTGKDYANDATAWETAMQGPVTIVPEANGGIMQVGAWFGR
jgi:HEAT repeat protein